MNRIRSIIPGSIIAAIVVLSLASSMAWADDGYKLWLKYDKVSDEARLEEYRHMIQALVVPGNSATSQVISAELHRGLSGLLGKEVPWDAPGRIANAVIAVTPKHYREAGLPGVRGPLKSLGPEGYAISTVVVRGARAIVIVAEDDRGLLYGAFHFLRLLQTRASISQVGIVSAPKVHYRLLNHWDNLDGTVERGYAGKSLWRWNELPATISPRYHDYARACASIGLNGAVLNNVNANPQILTSEYLVKIAALAGVFRPYGIRVFLSVNFSSPIAARFEQEGNRKGGIGNLKTSDPLDPDVQSWWNEKAAEIYRVIPDFGGFLVKASSEGMPGPQEYSRTHADGANMLARALKPFGGIVMWRSFVYDANSDADRVKRAYKEFVPLDGKFDANVFVQAKNGPLDFQPREPVQPLFGAMSVTPMMLELQITQEYLGHSTHLVYLAPMWEEYLKFDTYTRGAGSSLASIIDGSLRKHSLTGIAGVANIGDDTNWCGHLFGQANWYAFGRLAWDHALSAGSIADEWIAITFGHDARVDSTIRSMMMGSWEACVSYMTPLGLHHIMQPDFHYGPGPQHDTGRVDWRSTYYHRADSIGIGFDRSSTGSNAVSQYPSPLRGEFDALKTCPEMYLLWFHHVPWDYRMKSGRTLWDELCLRYRSGCDDVDTMYAKWMSLQGDIDPAEFAHVKARLEKQRSDAGIWGDTCLGYFQQYSKRAGGWSPVKHD
jgi:alpha-glucuronidase